MGDYVINGIPSYVFTKNSMRNIDIDQSYIHDGFLFENNLQFSLATTATKAISFITPADKEIHYSPSNLNTSGDKVTIELFENATVTPATGTTLVAYNHNRISSNVSAVILKNAPTVTVQGDKIAFSYLPGSTGVGQSRSGGELGTGNEWILKKGTTYIILITNGSTAANLITIKQKWFEVI